MLKSRALRVSLCVAIWAVVLAGMFAPKTIVDSFQAKQFDTWLHVGALTAMVVSARCALPTISRAGFWTSAVCLAAALEVLQPLIQPSRQFNETDLAANLIGVLTAAAILAAAAIRHRG